MANREIKAYSLSDPEQWVDAHGDYLYRYALLRLRNASWAEDAVQETFVAALKARERFSGQSTERTWLTGILKHKIADLFRKRQREIAASELSSEDEEVDRLFDEKGKWIEALAEWKRTPAEKLEQVEFWNVLKDCLSKLPERHAQAFMLRSIEGFESAEVCNIMEITATNLGAILHRARMRLRNCLEINWFKDS